MLSNGLLNKLPQKVFYFGPMFRYERPQKGRYRQFHQFGVESFGYGLIEEDVEIIDLGYQLLEKLNIKNIKLEINTLGSLIDRIKYKKILKEYFGNKNLSGDSKQRYENGMFLRILDSKNEKDKEIIKNAPKLIDTIEENSLKRIEKVLKGLDILGIKYMINHSLVRGLDYYCDTIFEFKYENNDILGKQQDTILAGGRYNNLIEMLGGPKSSSIGWACGMERISLIFDGNVVNKEILISLIFIKEENEKFDDIIYKNLMQTAQLLGK